MSVTARGYIRDYDPSTDTGTIELTGIGAIDTWLRGIKIHIAIPRGGISGGIPCVVTFPDVHRLCEAQVVSLADSSAAMQNSSGSITTQTQRLAATGGSAIGVTFAPAFTGIPTVWASADNLAGAVVSALTNTGCTVTIGGNPSQQYKVTITAQGV